MARSIISGGLWIRRACPAKRFGYGEVVDVYLQAKRDGAAVKRFFKRLLRNHGGETRKVTLVACMRKQLTILNTMMKNGTHWNEKYALALDEEA